ncbi:MAG TPA: hypothetical protein VJQ61_16080 [Sinomonas sp.]|nr:hypothetical protein [Sinomonas sp.]
MKTSQAAGGGKRTWAIVTVALLAALDIALVGAAYVHGHPDVQGTADPVPTYSSPVTHATPVPTATPSPAGSRGQR